MRGSDAAGATVAVSVLLINNFSSLRSMNLISARQKTFLSAALYITKSVP
jgi:hypothetical protein